jgi:hypothetical protein
MQLITLQGDIPTISHRVIAEHTGNEEHSISRIIRDTMLILRSLEGWDLKSPP